MWHGSLSGFEIWVSRLMYRAQNSVTCYFGCFITDWKSFVNIDSICCVKVTEQRPTIWMQWGSRNQSFPKSITNQRKEFQCHELEEDIFYVISHHSAQSGVIAGAFTEDHWRYFKSRRGFLCLLHRQRKLQRQHSLASQCYFGTTQRKRRRRGES